MTALVSPLILLPSSAPADCAGPSIRLSRGFVYAGRAITVEGEAWADGCDDAGACGFSGDPVEPMRGVRITLERKGTTVEEWTVDGSEFEQTIETADLAPGDYRVVAEHGNWHSAERFTVAAKK